MAERALRTRFSDALAALPDDRPTILVIDGLDQIDDAVGLYGLDWLPAALPARVKLVTSGASDTQRGTALRAALDHREHLAVEVAALSMRERDAIVRKVPILWAKMLGAEQIKTLLANPATENALYVRVALEELRGFGSFSGLDERIRTLPNASAAAPRRWWRRPPAPQDDIPESIYLLFVEAIKRLEDEFSVATVRAILTGILLSRSGLAERMRLGILAAGASDDTNVYARASPDQQPPYTISRQGLLKFYHEQMENAVRRYYLVDREAQTATHLRLAAYFDAQPWRLEAGAGVASPNLRKCDELRMAPDVRR